MPLQKTLVSVDLSGGIDTKTDQKLVLPSSLVELENGVFTVGSSITKRNGYSKLQDTQLDGTALPTGDALTSLKNELLVFGSNKLYSYTSGLGRWLDRGGFRSATTSAKDLLRNEYEQSAVDACETSETILYAWEDTSGGVRASVVDGSSNTVILDNQLISSTGKCPRCVVLGENLTLVYVDTSGTDSIKSTQINVNDPTSFSAAKTLYTDVNTSSPWVDVSPYTTSGDVSAVMAYADTSNTVKVSYITSTGAAGNLASGFVAPVTLSSQAEDSIAIYADTSVSSDVYVAFGKSTSSTGLKVFRLTSALVTTASTTSADATAIKQIGMVYNTSATIEVYYESNAAATYNHLVNKRDYTTASNTISSASVIMRSVGLVSKPFRYNSVTYFFVIHESSLQSTYFLIDSAGLVIAKLKQGLAGALPTRPMPSNVVNQTTGIFELPSQVQTRLESRDNDIYGLKGISRLKVDFVSNRNFLNKEMGETLFIGGGFVSAYDTQTIAELGFHIYPENVSVSTATSGGSIAAGTYSYRVIYTYQDAVGHINRSAPSVGVSQTTTGSTSVNTVTIPTLRITDHTTVTVEVYRTVDDGTIYYKCGSTTNSTSSDTVTFSDTGSITDSNLLAKEQLYTTGGVVDVIAPPSTSVLGIFKNRMFVVSSEDPQVLYYSKKRLGEDAVEFNDAFTLTVNKAKEVTAFQEMDEKLLIFEDDRIFAITGDGPTPAGLQNNFSEAQLITSDVGCTDPRSVVLIPQGCLFKSNKGIYLLNRSLETVYLGAPVETFNDLTITSADLLQSKNQVRFLTSDGSTLVYDYYYNKFSTFTGHKGQGATVWDKAGNYVYLRTDGEVWEENTAFTDNGAPINLKLTTAWIKTNQVQGFQRIRKAFILGDFKSDHSLRMEVGFNYAQYYLETHNFNYITDLSVNNFADENPYASETFASGSAGVADGIYQFRAGIKNQKCQSIRFSLSDTEDTSPGQAYSISNLMMEVGIKDTGMKLPSQKLV